MNIKHKILLITALIAYVDILSAQTIPFDQYVGDTYTYTSPNPKMHPGYQVSDMLHFSPHKVLEYGADITSDIGCSLPKYFSYIKIEIFKYNASISNGKGELLFMGIIDYDTGDDTFYGLNVSYGVHPAVNSTNIKALTVRALESTTSFSAFPVVVEAEISYAVLNWVKIPGISGLQLGHECLGKTSEECKALREITLGDKNQVIVTAHRGYWGYGDLAEVSMNALRNGYNNKYISIEIDVQQSKDGELLLLHDQRVNRMISFIETQGQEYPTYDTGDQSDPIIQAAWIQNLNYNTTTPNIPKAGGGTWSTYPALKNGRMIDRRGNPTTDPVARFDDALNYIQNEAPGDKPILLSLDIKEKEEARYLETLSKCLAKAKQYNCLHKIIFKPGSTVNISAEAIRTYLSDPSRNQWNDFAYKTNVIVIVVKNASKSTADSYVPPTRDFINGWLNVPSVITFEYIYKYNDANLDVLLKSLPEFDNKSVIAYTKQRGVRTGAFWEIATDGRGVPSGTVNAWYSKTSPDETLTSQYGLVTLGVDARNNPEFTIAPPSYNSDSKANYPGVIVTDRPDIVQKILELHGRYNNKTKRP